MFCFYDTNGLCSVWLLADPAKHIFCTGIRNLALSLSLSPVLSRDVYVYTYICNYVCMYEHVCKRMNV
jgi:hypothetical protein